MKFQYELTDRDNITTVIEEPQGWDSMEIELTRDLETHGMFFDYQVNEFIFYNKARKIIRQEWQDHGIKGDLTLTIKLKCSSFLSWITGNYTYEELYKGKLLFGKYDAENGDANFVKIPVETTSDIMEFKNRFDQKVDLQTLLGFDQTTALTPYDNLGIDITLPGKTIRVQNKAHLGAGNTTNVLLNEVPEIEYDTAPEAWQTAWFQVVPQMEITDLFEFGKFATAPAPEHIFTCSGFYNDNLCPDLFKVRNGDVTGTIDRTLYFDWASCTPLLYNEENRNNFAYIPNFSAEIDYELKFDTQSSRIIFLNKCVIIKRKDGSFEILSNDQVVSATGNIASPGGYVTGTYWGPGETHNVVESKSFPTITLNDGDYLFVALCGLAQYINTEATAGDPAYDITGIDGAVSLVAFSKAADSPAKLFLINEAISRVSEAITNDKIRAYSEHFGRTDSQPYAVDADGCGSLEAISQGIFIRRQENRIPGKTFGMNVSMQDLWKGIDPIHHLGMGIEPDTNRPGFNRLRVEHWKYFYSDDVVLTLNNVRKIRTRVIENEHYSIFKCGYEKWEAEEFNGIDECLTKREYRTTFTQLKNELVKISSFIASPYTWEVTRRKSNTDSKDWRYDNDTFIVCLVRDGDTFGVEIPNISDAENIIDPDTFYNWRIRPVYNAMRWIDKLHSGYRPASSPNTLYFTDGTGNYHAKGEMTSTDCKLETDPLAENINITETLFDDPEQCAPKVKPERTEIEYPMSLADFKNLQQNPYGKIVWTGCESGEGWIETLNYQPIEGMATFLLIPKYQ